MSISWAHEDYITFDFQVLRDLEECVEIVLGDADLAVVHELQHAAHVASSHAAEVEHQLLVLLATAPDLSYSLFNI